MATYLLKKWQLRIFYTTTPAGLSTLSHEHRIFLNLTAGEPPGAGFADYTVTKRDATTDDLESWLTAYLAELEPAMAPQASLIRAELHAADVGSENFVFYSTYPIGHVGSSAAAMVANNAQIMTFRCQNGDSARIQLAEPPLGAGPKDPYPFSNPASLDLANFVVAVTSPIVNKRFSFLIAPVNNCVEQHEIYWDERNR